MKKVYAASLLLAAGILHAAAGESDKQELINLGVTARVDYQRLWNDGNAIDSNSGFEGKYLFLRADGNFTKDISYSWRQRFNTAINSSKFFNSTDWIFVKYSFNRWAVSGGKEVVAIGGYEYDANPADIYSSSLFWQNVAPFQYGASLSYGITKNDRLTFQFAESTFRTPENENLYAYSLHWTGKHGIYSALSSVNMIEYSRGHFINYIVLGNRFDVNRWSLELDLMNRAAAHQTFLLKDVSVIGNLTYRPSQKIALIGKVTYDVNRANNGADLCVLEGTELTMAGAGIEYTPISSQKHALRLHANCFYSWGTNANTADVMQNKSLMVDLGVKFNIDLLSILKK